MNTFSSVLRVLLCDGFAAWQAMQYTSNICPLTLQLDTEKHPQLAHSWTGLRCSGKISNYTTGVPNLRALSRSDPWQCKLTITTPRRHPKSSTSILDVHQKCAYHPTNVLSRQAKSEASTGMLAALLSTLGDDSVASFQKLKPCKSSEKVVKQTADQNSL